MTLAINIKDKPYAVGLSWITVDNEKKAGDKLRQLRGDSYVTRKCPNKVLQVGIVHGAKLGKLPVAADNVAIKFSKSSGIFVCKIDYTDKKLSPLMNNPHNKDDYWAVAIISGNIASGSDVILSGENEVVAWIDEFCAIHNFEVFAEANIAQLLPNINVGSVDVIYDECFLKPRSKLRIRDKSGGIGLIPMIAGAAAVIALLGGGYYFLTNDGGDKKLSDSEKNKIINKLKKDELTLALDFLQKDNFDDIIIYLSALSEYPKKASSWTVSTLVFDVESRIAMFTWKMTSKGNMEEIKTIRPMAGVVIDQSKTSGDMAVENIQLMKATSRHVDASVDSASDKRSIDTILTEVRQLHDVLLKTGQSVDIQKKKPPSKSGIKFNGTYKSYEFTLAGKSYSQMIMVIQRLSQIKSVVPTKLLISSSGASIKSWTINGKALIK